MFEKPLSAESLFYRALEINDAVEREAFLASISSPELREIVDALLEDHAQAGALFDNCAAALEWPENVNVEEIEEGAVDANIGSRLGPYTLTRCLGEGGSGIVYEAEQKIPVQRRVAIKILKIGLDSAQVISRFNMERQTLALMEHPNIAHYWM